MKINTANHFRQRRAVEALKERMKVRVIGQVFGRGDPISRVSIGGEYYDVGPGHLAMLRAGDAPNDIGLDPIENPDESM